MRASAGPAHSNELVHSKRIDTFDNIFVYISNLTGYSAGAAAISGATERDRTHTCGFEQGQPIGPDRSVRGRSVEEYHALIHRSIVMYDF
jgi:hypothetical protein